MFHVIVRSFALVESGAICFHVGYQLIHFPTEIKRFVTTASLMRRTINPRQCCVWSIVVNVIHRTREKKRFVKCEPTKSNYIAPAAFSMPSNSPFFSKLLMPPIGPSLHPPTNAPLIQTAGTLVLPNMSPISARIALPSSSLSNSIAVYFAPLASNTALASMQNGHVVKLNINTGVESTRELILVRIAVES